MAPDLPRSHRHTMIHAPETGRPNSSLPEVGAQPSANLNVEAQHEVGAQPSANLNVEAQHEVTTGNNASMFCCSHVYLFNALLCFISQIFQLDYCYY